MPLESSLCDFNEASSSLLLCYCLSCYFLCLIAAMCRWEEDEVVAAHQAELHVRDELLGRDDTGRRQRGDEVDEAGGVRARHEEVEPAVAARRADVEGVADSAVGDDLLLDLCPRSRRDGVGEGTGRRCREGSGRRKGREREGRERGRRKKEGERED
ncbi:Os10g0496600 [Oryza sativa Japonica Group]|uniref:Os10g0496600 protein n=2 Tax=Oryza sativa subsp. japonica TaxID=39947 RepID=A0A0P0XWQ0_ORYSJ|nr:Os10g0496600 [Oryza sativa Japonica Group]BAT11484.1 Os10g0496600 [Oryza sativa Japonica Group]|eukprot:NP_001176224.1 Os10g0496600 [Oryza sativa Japonica Group]